MSGASDIRGNTGHLRKVRGSHESLSGQISEVGGEMRISGASEIRGNADGHASHHPVTARSATPVIECNDPRIMRVLIVYASKHGHTQRVAEHMAGVLRGAGAETAVFEVSGAPRELVADLVIVAGSVYF